MTRLFVFGNGFDLAHKLPTKYQDFFYFIEGLQCFAASGIARLSQNEDVKSNLTEDSFEYLKSNLSISPIPAYLNTIIQTLRLTNRSECNPWHQYFAYELRQRTPNITWIDFEKEIQTCISNIERNEPTKQHLHDITKAMHSFKMLFPEDISSLSNDLRSKTSPSPLLIKELSEKVALYLYQELLRYAFCFELYLRFYISEHCLQKNKDRIELFDSLFGQTIITDEYRARQKGEFGNTPGYVLSFNYTDTCEVLYGIDKRIHHLHGQVRSKEDLEVNMDNDTYQLQTPLVLGFHSEDPEKAFSPSPYLWFEKFYQRMLHKTGIGIYEFLRATDEIVTTFYGHSLDITDKDLIEQIYERSKKIYVYYHSETALPTLIANLIRIFGKDEIMQAHNSSKIEFLLAH